jgi:ABC-2 type transport system permease protein
MITTLIGGFFYAIGADILTGLFGNKTSELMKLLGSGARFESITRGVIDIRDLYFYFSIMGVFLALNVFELERQRWAGNAPNSSHRQWGVMIVLCVANFLVANLWLAPVDKARADITSGNIYSISQTTRHYLTRLNEPLMIRGYFSAKTHPLLAPMVPRLRDLLEEYAIAGGDKVRVEFVDPVDEPDIEEEAAQKYGIRPVPLQFASKYQSAVVNSYFDILVEYGDQFETIGFQDLIEVKSKGVNDIQVELRDPEYDITRTIKKVLYAYQGAGDLFENISHPITFKGYFSPDELLPQELSKVKEDLDGLLKEFSQQAGGKLKVEIKDPNADGGELAKELTSKYGFKPMSANLFSESQFWFYMLLEGNDRIISIPLSNDLSSAGLKRSIEAGLKRFSTGFLKTVAIHTPNAQVMGKYSGEKSFSWLQKALEEEHSVVFTDFMEGKVPDEADLLVLASPENLNQKQLFAVDQFLMRGGTVILSTSPFMASLGGGQLSMEKSDSGLTKWLSHYGINLKEEVVLDPHNAAFPIPMERQVAGFKVKETRMVPYPFFVDVRSDGMDQKSGITSGLNQVTINWACPIEIDKNKNVKRKVVKLLKSSDQAWVMDSDDMLMDSLNIQPDFKKYGELGFPAKKERGQKLLAVAVEGRFQSYFKDKSFSLIDAEKEKDRDTNTAADNSADKSENETKSKEGDAEEKKDPELVIDRLIEHSTDSARIILFASNSFLSDGILQLASSGMGTQYINPVILAKNAVDWSLEDRDLLGIRGRTHFSRTLFPLSRSGQLFFEYFNYAIAGLGLLLVFLIRRWMTAKKRYYYQTVLNGGGGL